MITYAYHLNQKSDLEPWVEALVSGKTTLDKVPESVVDSVLEILNYNNIKIKRGQ